MVYGRQLSLGGGEEGSLSCVSQSQVDIFVLKKKGPKSSRVVCHDHRRHCHSYYCHTVTLLHCHTVTVTVTVVVVVGIVVVGLNPQ